MSFQIKGTEIPPLVGRETLKKRVWDALTKESPDNISIVAPYLVGKSVFLNWLVDRAKQDDSPYEFVLEWHLGRITPSTDDEFMEQLIDQVRDVLGSKADQAGARSYLEDKKYKKLREVTDALSDEGRAILMVLDGFDKPLAKADLTSNLWDLVRDIFYGKKHKIVTATRAPLVELIRSEDAATSHFWNIFETHRLSIYDRGDCEQIVHDIDGIDFSKGAMTELLNWSGGVPVIALQILNQVLANGHKGEIDNDMLNQSAAPVASQIQDHLMAIWSELPTSSRDAFTNFLKEGALKCSAKERESLVDRGLIEKDADQVASRILSDYAEASAAETGSLAKLFDTFDNYKQNIRELLERRLNHINNADERLHHLISAGIGDLPKYPDYCLNNLTQIEKRALRLIWDHELGDAKEIPADIQAYWTLAPRDKNGLVKTMMNSNDWRVPSKPLDQVRLLQILTGCWQDFDPRTKSISKDTYVLVDAIHTLRNRNQHGAGQQMRLGVAVAAIMTCIELLACLAEELN